MRIRNILLSLFILFAAPALMSAQGKLVQMKGSFLRQLQQRDSILIADQLQYGFVLEGVEEGMGIGLPDYSEHFCDSVEVLGGWKLDTLKVVKGKKGAPSRYDLEGSIVITTFEEGKYLLPPLFALRMSAGVTDTLVFEPQEMEVMTMPVDTATFEIHDIKGQINYPVTFAEVAPYIIGGLLAAALIALIIWLVRRYLRRGKEDEKSKDPAYIVALKALEAYRGNKYWAPEKQKQYYSGITDTLRVYMVDRFGIGATEMTTAEIFDALKNDKDITPDLFSATKELFELADFVKFAKHSASDEENAAALPVAVRFVTSTIQADATADEQAGASKTEGGQA